MQLLRILCILLAPAYAPIVYSMDNSAIPTKAWHFRELLPELQKRILLSDGYIQDTLRFLGTQPTTLAIPNGHTSSIESIEVYGNALVTKSRIDWLLQEWFVIIWDIQTNKHVIGKEPYKPWEGDGPVVKNNNKAVQVKYSYSGFDSAVLWDVETGKKVSKIKCTSEITSLTGDKDIVAIGLRDHTVKIWNTLTETKEEDVQTINDGGSISSVAIDKGTLAIGTKLGDVKIWRIYPNKKEKWIHSLNCHTDKITVMVLHKNILFTGSHDKKVKIWNINPCSSSRPMHILAGPNGHRGSISSIALVDDNTVATGSRDRTVKVWPLKINDQGTAENNPLVWILEKADMLQLNFIWRAYKATMKNQEFVIDLPEKLNVLQEEETQEQQDGRVYFTLPLYIREYIRTRLNIRRLAKTLPEKASVVYNEADCLIM